MARGRAIGRALASLVIGIIIGLVIGWGLLPVEYTNADPADLRPSYMDDYVRMISAAHEMDGDLTRAKLRLAELNLANPMQVVNRLGAREKPPGRGALLRLAEALSSAPPPQRPTQGALPEPTSVFLVAPTRLVPVFRLVERSAIACAEDGESAYLRIQVRDLDGKDLPDVGIEIRWAIGDDTVYTGLKPERGVGYADFEAVPDKYSVTILNAQSDAASDLVVGEAPANCRADRGQTPRGWRLVFQKHPAASIERP